MELFSSELIKIDYPAIDKKSCIEEMVEFLYEQRVISSVDKFLQAVWERERIMSTGIGHQLAIPHAHSKAVKEFKVAVYLLDNVLEFNSIDGEPVKLILMLAVPEKFEKTYMKALSKISNFLRKPNNREALLNSQSKAEILDILKGIEI